ncbi:MAG: formate dehydrogenase accessory sulfurtransferase FdhD [Dehalococcoidales bacterium]|nr:formate dehydrogenase accessory sulfurtransferase FdhD [Dehalococcoidales bacterium]
MAENTKRVSIYRVSGEDREQTEAEVVREYAVTIKVNGAELAVVSGSPAELDYLAVGLAQSQGILTSKDDIRDIRFENEETVNIITVTNKDIPDGLMLTSSGGRSSRTYLAETLRTESKLTIPASRAMELMEEFEHYSGDFKRTGGVHSAALCTSDTISYFSEDIGRHNAIDKVCGKCLMDGLSPEDFFIITSGRVSSDIMLKIVKRKIPVIIARNSPTDVAIEMAEKAGVTLLGFVRGTSMNVYTHGWRVT